MGRQKGKKDHSRDLEKWQVVWKIYLKRQCSAVQCSCRCAQLRLRNRVSLRLWKTGGYLRVGWEQVSS